MAGLRALTLADVADGLALSSASGWNQTAADWERALTLPGTAAWGIEREGRVVSTTTAIRYGDELAWIGMVLTAEDYRGQGLASQLMTAALTWLGNCRTVKLDATAQGAPLYRRFGFVDEGPVTRYIGRPPTGTRSFGRPPTGTRSFGRPPAGTRYIGRRPTGTLDRTTTPGPDAFEADRAALLAALGTPVCLADGSFAYGRTGRNAPFFGPCVATEESGAELLQWLAGEVEGEFMLDRMGAAPEGFRPARELMRMYRGEPKPTSPRQFAFAGFEFG